MSQNRLVTTSLLALAAAAGFASAAMAQSVSAPGRGDAGAASAVGVGEIIVTAQHREERLRDVPISITSKTGDQLQKAGVTTLEDLQSVVPGLRIDASGVFIKPTIRGISPGSNGPGTDTPVAIYLDGVYLPNQLTNHFEFADLARIEVDKGPQGTLYGRNATGGAIAIFTKTPSFTPSGDFEVGYGNYNDVLAKGFVTGPIAGDVLAGSVSAYYERHDDYDYDIGRRTRSAGLDSKIVRAKLLFQPNTRMSFTLTGAYQDRSDTDGGEATPINGNTIGWQDPTSIIASKPHDASDNLAPELRVKDASVNLNSKFDLGVGTLTSITSATADTTYYQFDNDRSYNSNQVSPAITGGGDGYQSTQQEHTYTEDINFASKKFGILSFIAGFDYFSDDNEANNTLAVYGPNNKVAFSLYSHFPVTAYAGYAEATITPTDRLSFIVGGRYSWEHRSVYGAYNGFGGGSVRTVTFDSLTPRASVLYKLTDDVNLYFTYDQGFKSGGLSSTAFLSPIGAAGSTYKPETITAYEGGIKGQITRRISFDVSAFYYDYSNLQVQVNINGSNLIQNAGKSRIYGVDLDTTARVTDEFTLTASFEYLNARYLSYANAEAFVPMFLNGLPDGNAIVPRNASGNIMPRAPDITFSLTADYRKVFSPGTLDLNATVYYSGRVYFDSIERLSQAPYATLAADASWQPTGSKFRFELWAKNITNTTYLVSTSELNFFDGGTYAPPPTFGAAIHYDF